MHLHDRQHCCCADSIEQQLVYVGPNTVSAIHQLHGSPWHQPSLMAVCPEPPPDSCNNVMLLSVAFLLFCCCCLQDEHSLAPHLSHFLTVPLSPTLLKPPMCPLNPAPNTPCISPANWAPCVSSIWMGSAPNPPTTTIMPACQATTHLPHHQ